MIHNILVPTDGSPLSARAARTAAGLAKALGAKLVGFTATGDYPVGGPTARILARTPLQQDFSAQQAKAAEHRLQAIADVAQAADVRYETFSAGGEEVYQAILDAARTAGCDLIVMASRGGTGVGGFMLGGDASRVLTHTELPVLIDHGRHGGSSDITNILVPVDGSAPAAQAAVAAARLAQALGARLTGLCVERPDPPVAHWQGHAIGTTDAFRAEQARWSRNCLAELQEAAREHGVAATLLTAVGNHPAEQIVHTARQQHCDLVFMASQRRSGLSGLLLGSTANGVLRNTDLPVWIHRRPELARPS